MYVLLNYCNFFFQYKRANLHRHHFKICSNTEAYVMQDTVTTSIHIYRNYTFKLLHMYSIISYNFFHYIHLM